LAYRPITEDPEVPDGSIVNAEIVVTQYFTPDGFLQRRCFYDGAVPLSTVLGLLELAKADIIARCD
jgi:hypothetical protein